MASLLDDEYLKPYEGAVKGRSQHAYDRAMQLTMGRQSLSDWAQAHEFYGLHRTKDGWVFREWAPNATSMWIVGDFTGWKTAREFELFRIPGTDTWGREFPAEAIRHGDNYRLEMRWEGGHGERIPAYARYVVQDETTKLYSAKVWDPPKRYVWRNATRLSRKASPRSSTKRTWAWRARRRKWRRTRNSATTSCRASKRPATTPSS